MKNIIYFILAVTSVLSSSACKKETTGSPEITINGTVITVAEDVSSGSADFSVTLSPASEQTVTVSYSTSDSTAVAGDDYVAITSGTITFQSGQTSKSIKVNILHNTARNEDAAFKVTLSNAVNAELLESEVKVKIINIDYATLVWSDEFETGPLNTAVWNYELGAGGWGNEEKQTYTNSQDNVHIDSGYLHITALDLVSPDYTSGRITTQGKKEFKHFRVDLRAMLPDGQGLWPALWTLGGNFSTAGWPGCGEIDIMEHLGHEPSKVYGALHWNNNGHTYITNSRTLSTGDFISEFHVFSLIWTPNNMRWLVDDQEYAVISRSQASAFPFDSPQFFIFNVAVGGKWPGNPDETTIFPQHMIVDYIRVYQ